MTATATGPGTVDQAEVDKFSAMAAEWWDDSGPARPLHLMNPCRLGYIKAQICAEFGRDEAAIRALDGLKVLDIGCGGGLVCEPMARTGAEVTGLDASAENVEVARVHAAEAGLDIDYRAITAEALADSGAQFDVVLALEIIEHVADPALFTDAVARLVRPGGLAVLSTLNRTPQSYAVAIVGAEYVLRWLPKGTHDWSKFPTPDELDAWLTTAGLAPIDRRGMRLDPIGGGFTLCRDTSVNYLTAARKA